MAVDERARHQLHERLDQVLGPDHAATLMEYLPPTGWGDVVTREYLDSRLEQLDARTDRRFTEVNVKFAEVNGRFDAVDERFKRMEQLIEATKQELLAAMRGEINVSVVSQTRAIAQQTRTTIFALITAIAGIAALAYTLAQLV